MPYEFLKDTHNILRWLVILAAFWAIARYWSGVFGGSAWTKKDKMAGLIFSTLLNVQVLLGIVLYATSPFMKALTSNFGPSMKDPIARFFLVEHPFAMLVAAVLAQIGFSASKRAPEDRKKFLKGAIFYTLSALIMLAAIPWPFLKYGRPLFPALGN